MSMGSGGRSRGGELVVITKTYDLLLWTCNHTSRFPRSHRHVLVAIVERPAGTFHLVLLVQTLSEGAVQE